MLRIFILFCTVISFLFCILQRGLHTFILNLTATEIVITSKEIARAMWFSAQWILGRRISCTAFRATVWS
jgi:hypothetical protein